MGFIPRVCFTFSIKIVLIYLILSCTVCSQSVVWSLPRKIADAERGFEYTVDLDVDSGQVRLTSRDVGESNLKISLTVEMPPGLFEYKKPLETGRGASFSLTTPHHSHSYRSSGQINMSRVSVQYSMKSVYKSDENCFALYFHTKKQQDTEEQEEESGVNKKESVSHIYIPRRRNKAK